MESVSGPDRPAAIPGDEKAAQGARLCWTAHPLREEPWPKSALLVVLVAGLALGAALSFGGPGYGLLSLVVLAGSLSRYLLPTRYTLDETGVRIAHLGWTRQRSWGQFCRVDIHPDGVFLSPFVRPTRLDSFRGCFLRSHQNQEAVTRFAQAHVADGSS